MTPQKRLNVPMPEFVPRITQGFRQATLVLSLVVVLCVCWSLKLTGITLAGDAFCGKTEHTHTEECTRSNLICGLEEEDHHFHTEDCILRELTCELQESQGHTHEDTCWQTVTTYSCGLSDAPAHTHTDECIPESTQLVCEIEESQGHTHGDSCWQTVTTYSCGLSDAPAHIHTDECIAENTQLICGIEESEEHTHEDSCWRTSIDYICGLSDAPAHTHTDECITEDTQLICEIEESQGHTHGDACWQTSTDYSCGLSDAPAHTHTDECITEDIQLICEIEESQGHTHGDACWNIGAGFGCGLSDDPTHMHTDECVTVDTQLICGSQSIQGHTHSEECYETEQLCQLEEHTHSASCYSNDSADLETADDWEASLSDLAQSSIPGDNVAAIARSQLGAKESLLNFQVDENGIRRGITRYGQWYGNPYGDWSAMFVCFCLDYAGVTNAPLNAGPEAMHLAWQEAGFYAPMPDYVPAQGNLLFLDKDGSGTADAVAVITGSDSTAVYAIEGDIPSPADPEETEGTVEAGETVEAEDSPIPDAVMETAYLLSDPAILGFGLVPIGDRVEVLAPGDACTVWFDGTMGGIMSLGGSPNQSVSTRVGAALQLPENWTAPDKYSYVLKGWYDVTNNSYHAPGEEVEVTGNMVFYPDWIAASYDIGVFNSQVADTVSTNDFVTVRMFDYNFLFNVLSSRADVSFSRNSHTETWRLLTNGNSPYSGEPTLNYIFRDWDRGGEDISYPNGVNNPGPHYPTSAGQVYPGLCTSQIADLLFNHNTQVIGKHYLGTADHLFQLCLDANHEHYGYYYYNSERNAASYNQSARRFYVYDYLECTRQSANSGDEKGKMSDFLPLNSPYTNTNGKDVSTYRYDGIEGEYQGTAHFMYDHEYNTNSNTPNNVGTNFLFGMTIDIDFYLPNDPGSGGNQDIFGKDMHFLFSGDDDVWIFIDGKMVLDLGGIHSMESGDINFSAGQVTVNGAVNNAMSNNLRSIGSGEHTLTLYYLERGSSMSNCSIYFNLAPRFSFNIQKEDVLTRHVLDGAKFSVYLDEDCSIPAELWSSKESHDQGDPSTNEFTVLDGAAHMWGMGAGNRYYIKETKGPDDPNYEGLPNGIIQLTFDYEGTANYNVKVIDDGSGISGGFTVHGFRIDAETQEAYIIATNAPKWVEEVTSLEVWKQWDDQANHTGDTITVYLTVTTQEGTVRRLQEIQLGSGNGWHHTWENLPKFWEDGTPIQYGVEEAYIPGYYNTIEEVSTFSAWVSGSEFREGETCLIRSSLGFLSTLNDSSDTGFMWVDQSTAESSHLAQWTATAGNGGVKLTNMAGQTLTFYYGGGSPTDFYASTGGESNNAKQYYKTAAAGGGLRLYHDGANGRDYYLIADMTGAQKFRWSTSAGDGLVLTPMYKQEAAVTAGVGYLITNTCLEKETALTVEKFWDYGNLESGDLHRQFEITVKLLANGRDTGRTVTLSLKNGWKDTFRGLPYADSNGHPISYTIEEVWENEEWIPTYGEVAVVDGTTPSYTTTLTNRYRAGIGGPELPSTGTASRMLYILCGGGIMLTSLVYGLALRHKRERRPK